jgi:uncharacterized membrane protein YoaT (DUF817 family)
MRGETHALVPPHTYYFIYFSKKNIKILIFHEMTNWMPKQRVASYIITIWRWEKIMLYPHPNCWIKSILSFFSHFISYQNYQKENKIFVLLSVKTLKITVSLYLAFSRSFGMKQSCRFKTNIDRESVFD